jgi:DNA repair exonuclease SbcCD nuclease subunit
MAHGALQMGEIARTHEGNTRGHFPISLKAASTGRLDYLALGDWHSFLEVADGSGTISYSGAPEATCFGEPDSGTVTIVTIDRPGERPKLERVAVGRLRWLKRAWPVHAAGCRPTQRARFVVRCAFLVFRNGARIRRAARNA